MANVVRYIMGMPQQENELVKREDEVFGFFGASMEIIVMVCNLIAADIDKPGAYLKKLLWTNVFLMIYSTT